MAASRRKKPTRRTRRIKKGVSPRRAAYILEGLACFAILAWLGYAFLGYVKSSGEFQVRWIDVTGITVLHEEEVSEASGLTQDNNLLLMNRTKIQQRVEAMPYVKRCEVSTVFPDTVVLHIVERSAAATLLIHNRAYVIDYECVILRELNEDMTHVGPFVTEIGNLQFVEPGDAVDKPALWAALRVWKSFSQMSIADDVTVSELSARNADDIRMYCDELPYVIHWGRNNFEVQAQRLDALWREKGGKLACKEYLDLRWDEDLACK